MRFTQNALESLPTLSIEHGGGRDSKHSPFRAASPARQPRALARLGARAARLVREILSRVGGALIAHPFLSCPFDLYGLSFVCLFIFGERWPGLNLL